MRRFDKIAVGGFVFAAIVAFVIGVGTIVYTHTVVRPKLARISAEVVADIEMAEQGLHAMAAHADAFEASVDASRQSAVAAMHELPTVLEQSTYLSWHAAQTLDQSAHTLRAVADATELVLPDEAIEQNAEMMSTTARSLEGLAPQLDALREEADRLADNLARASGTIEQLREALRRANVTLKQAQERLRRTRQAIRTADLAMEASLGTSTQAGLYLLLAVLLLGMAGLWKRSSEPPSGF